MRSEARARILAVLQSMIEMLEDSDVEIDPKYKANPSYKVMGKIHIKPAKQNKSNIKMKGITMDLDGELPGGSWDMRQGTCVFDWLENRYGNRPGAKKLVKKLDELWPTGREHGVSTEDLKLFAEKLNIYMYALDEDDGFISVHQPKSPSHCLPALCFRVKNRHMYPIIDKRVANYAQCYQSIVSESSIRASIVSGMKMEPDYTPVISEIVVLDAQGGLHEQAMLKTMKELGTEVFPAKNIRCDKKGTLNSFILKDKLYVFKGDKTMSRARAIYEANGRVWKGESIGHIVGEVLDHHKLGLRGPVNGPVLESLTHPCVKNRAHYGWISPTQPGDWAFDVNRHYTYVIQNPLEPWMLLQLQDDWKPYEWSDTVALGLYYVMTDDMTLMHGSNIYSSAMVAKAKAEGIPMTIHSQCLASAKKPTDLFTSVVEEIKTLCHGNERWEKGLVNAMIGTLGQHQYKNRRYRINTDQETVFNDMMKEGASFLKSYDDLYVYGSVTTNKMLDIATPAWIQVLDQSNILLYDLIKKSGGVCIGRKTDCAVMRGGSLVFGSNVGDPRDSEVPDMTGMKEASERSVPITLAQPLIWDKLEWYSSNQAEEIYQAMLKNRGLLVEGRAGTGKTHVGHHVVKRFKEDYPDSVIFKVAYTNKAALNIGGETIHKWLHINEEGKIDTKYLKSLTGKMVLIWPDEISMNSSFIWNHLRNVKSLLPNAMFLLSGDHRQCAPVEEVKVDWFNSDIVRSIAHGVKVELTERQRYDVALWNLAEDVWEKQLLGIKKRTVFVEEYSEHQNICYLNETRGLVNKISNDYQATLHAEKKRLGEMWVYAGMPVIAAITRRDQYANNESFSVVSYDDAITLKSIRQGVEHIIKITEETFLKEFELAYCITTHKLQGDTIDAPVYIWDTVRMNRNILYTAVTRVRKMSQIHITSGTPDPHL